MSVNPDPRCNPCHDGCGCVQDEMARLEAENKRLRSFAYRYMDHDPSCSFRSRTATDCDCGMTRAWRELDAARKAGEEPR